MGLIKVLADAAYSNYNTTDVPASGIKQPRKPEIRDLFAAIDSQFASIAQYGGDIEQIKEDVLNLQTASATGIAPFETYSDMISAGIASGAGAWVFDDPDDSKNGVWKNNTGSYAQLVAISLPGLQIDISRTQSSAALALDLSVPEVLRQKPVFSSGVAAVARALSIISGEAFPFVWDGTRFDCGVFGFNVIPAAHGKRLRVRIYAADASTLVATGWTPPLSVSATVGSDLNAQGVASFKLDKVVTTTLVAAGVIYIAIDFPNGAQLFAGHSVVGYRDQVNYTTYPAKYTLLASPQDSLANWTDVTPTGTPQQIAVRLYDSKKFLSSSDTLAAVRLDPNRPIVTPRHYMLKNVEWSMYPQNIRSGFGDQHWSVTATGLSSMQAFKNKITLTAGIALNDQNVTIQYRDPNSDAVVGSGSYALTCVDPVSNAGATMNVLVVGDSLSAGASRWVARVAATAAANPTWVQPTFVGTQGTSPAKTEAYSGKSITWFATDPTSPFVISGAFDFASYLSNNSIATPDVIVIALGTNDVFSYLDDATLVAAIPDLLLKLDSMIGTVVSSSVSFKDVNTNVKTLICLPIPSAPDADAFGKTYSISQRYERYRRNIAIFWSALVGHYTDSESAGVFLVPANSVVDIIDGFNYDSEQAVSPYIDIGAAYPTYAAMMADLTPADGEIHYATDVGHYFTKVGPTTKGTWRPSTEKDGIIKPHYDAIHPNRPSTGAYEQWGDLMTAALNVLKAKALI